MRTDLGDEPSKQQQLPARSATHASSVPGTRPATGGHGWVSLVDDCSYTELTVAVHDV